MYIWELLRSMDRMKVKVINPVFSIYILFGFLLPNNGGDKIGFIAGNLCTLVQYETERWKAHKLKNIPSDGPICICTVCNKQATLLYIEPYTYYWTFLQNKCYYARIWCSCQLCGPYGFVKLNYLQMIKHASCTLAAATLTKLLTHDPFNSFSNVVRRRRRKLKASLY